MKTIAWTIRSVWSHGLFTLSMCAGLAASVTAVAQEPAPPSEAARCADGRPPKDPEAARVAFRAGQTAFSEGAYARAVELWDQAYRDDCTAHALLLNLAMAQELLGRPDDAIRTLKQFDSRSPGSPYVEANAKRIQRLERASAEKTRNDAKRDRALWKPAERPATEEHGLELSIPIVVTVAGGVVAVVGGVLFLEGRSAASSAEERCGASRQACADAGGVVDGERGRARAEVGGWMASAGLLTAAGGLVWHFISQPGRSSEQPPAAPRVSFTTDLPSGGRGVTWAGTF